MELKIWTREDGKPFPRPDVDQTTERNPKDSLFDGDIAKYIRDQEDDCSVKLLAGRLSHKRV